MKIKRLILCILLACSIGISVPLYYLYVHGTLTEIEAYEIGKKVLMETTNAAYPSMKIKNAGTVWRVHALCKYDGAYPFEQDYYVEISKRTGKVVKVGWAYIDREEYK